MFRIILLGFVSFFTDISSEMVYPLIPLYLTGVLGATPAIVGIIEGIAESTASLLKVFSGYYSDKINKRKPLALFGYGCAAIGKLILYISTSWTWVLTGRIVDRFGKGIRTAPRDAMIADSSHQDKLGSSFGLHRALDTAGAVIGIILAYYLFTSYEGEYRRVFLLALIPAAIGLIILSFVKDTKGVVEGVSVESKKEISFKWGSLDKRLKAFLIVVFIFALGNSSNQFLLLRAEELGYSPSQVILLYLTFNIIYAFLSYPAGRLSDHIGRKKLLVFGYLVYSLVYLGFALVQQSIYVWLLFGIYGIFFAMTHGVEKALVAEIAPSNQKATLIGLHGTLVGIGLLPASIIAGFLWNAIGAAAPFYFGSLMGLFAAIGIWLVV